MNILSDGIDAKTGYETTFLVQPIQVVANENVHNVAKEPRKCNFPDEASRDSIFSKYSQASCELECKIFCHIHRMCTSYLRYVSVRVLLSGVFFHKIFRNPEIHK